MIMISPLAENIRRCYVSRPEQTRSNLPPAGNDMFSMYLTRLAKVWGDANGSADPTKPQADQSMRMASLHHERIRREV